MTYFASMTFRVKRAAACTFGQAVLATYLIRAISSPIMWSFVYRDLSCFVIFIPVYSGNSMFIPPRSGTSFAYQVSGDLMLENKLLHQYFIE
jgi:hypothetical protein